MLVCKFKEISLKDNFYIFTWHCDRYFLLFLHAKASDMKLLIFYQYKNIGLYPTGSYLIQITAFAGGCHSQNSWQYRLRRKFIKSGSCRAIGISVDWDTIRGHLWYQEMGRCSSRPFDFISKILWLLIKVYSNQFKVSQLGFYKSSLWYFLIQILW